MTQERSARIGGVGGGTASGATRAYWVHTGMEDTPPLSVLNCFFAMAPTRVGGHIARVNGEIIVRDVTLFPDVLTHWGAIRWGFAGVLHLGPLRLARIRRAVKAVAVLLPIAAAVHFAVRRVAR